MRDPDDTGADDPIEESLEDVLDESDQDGVADTGVPSDPENPSG